MSENTQRRQPKGIPIGGEFASNEHDEALPLPTERDIARHSEEAAAKSSGAKFFGAGAIESLQSDGRTAASIAHGYLSSAESAPLDSSHWAEIEESLFLYGHNISSESNVWQPVSDHHRAVMQKARNAEFRRLRSAEIPREIRKRANELVSRGSDIGRSVRAATREQYADLSDVDRAIHDGLGLLGARRGYNAVPQAISNYAIKKAGIVGQAARKVLGWLNGKNKSVAILQRTSGKGGEKGVIAARLLTLLEHSDKTTQQLIDEIAEKKSGGKAADADIRAMLARRTHIELARFRSE